MAEGRTDIIQDVFATGVNYTGVGNLGITSVPKVLRYGFIFIKRLDLGLSSGAFNSVVLPLAPEAHNVDEQAATNITFTQNSGKFIERRGNLTKIITLSGTTGYNLNPKIPSILRRAMPPSEIAKAEGPNSGFSKFLQLRNLFRKYWAMFSDDAEIDLRATSAFIFVNEKEDEAWIVEPMSFKMVRQSPRNKFTYHYEIVLQTIAPAENMVLGTDPTTLFQNVMNVAQIVGTIAETIVNTAAVLGDVMAFATGAIREAVTSLLAVVNRIADGLTLIADGVESFIELPGLIKGQADALGNSFQGAFERLQQVGEDVKASTGQNPIPFEAQKAAIEIASLVALLAGRPELFAAAFPEAWANILVNYDPRYGFGGFDQNLIAPLTRQGVKEAEILPGDDLINIAIKEMGDASRFMELAILNNLKPPFISPNQESRLPNTLAPGDPILVPTFGSTGSAKAPIKTTVFTDPTLVGKVLSHSALTTTVDTAGKDFRPKQWEGFTVEIVSGSGAGQTRIVSANEADTFSVTKVWSTNPDATSVFRFYLKRLGIKPRKSATEQLLGVDLKLVGSDLSVSDKGDIVLVDGTDNVQQAIKTKIDTKPGELAAHPAFGLGFLPGHMANTDNILTYKVAVRQTLLSDRRISDVQQMQVEVERDVLRLQAYVLLSGTAQPFSVDTRGGQ